MASNLRELIPAFFTGPGGRPLSEDEIARRRQVAGSLLAQATDTSPNAGGGASILAKAIQGLSYGINEGRAERASAANAEASQANIAAMLGGAGGAPAASAFPPAPSANVASALTGGAPDVASARVEQAHGVGAPANGDIRGGIIEAASALGIDPVDLATVISYETAGTFDPTKRGPTTQWGQHRGLIQFGEPQAKEYGVNWDDPIGSQLGANGAVANYLRKAGVTPGMGILDVYSAVNAGRVGRYNASDANNGGAPGTVRDKVERQMGGHRQKALSLLGDLAPTNAVAANEAMATGGIDGGLTPAALNSWAAQNYNPAASIDRIAATGGAATPSTIGEADAREILAARPADASAYVGPGQTIAASDIPGIMAPVDEGVIVAESPEDIAAAELAMNDPAFAVPVAQEVDSPQPAPAVAPQVAQALTALPVNEALPMAGGVNNPNPIVPTAPQNPMQGLNPAVVQALSNPNATPQERAVAQALLQQHVAQNQALQAQAQEAQQRAEMLAQRRGLAGRMGIDPNYAVDDTIWKAASDKAFRDPASYSAGSYRERPDGTLEQVPLNPTGDIQNYEYYERKEREAGRVPLSPLEYEQALRRSGATSVTVGGKEQTPGWKKIDENFGDTYLSWQAGGWADNRKQVAQLRESLGMIQKAASEGRNISGLIGALPESLAPFINPEGTIAREGVEEVVQRSLREILGAQFTEKEGERLIARAYNPRLSPAENAKRVSRLLEQVESMGEARQSMVDYFDQNGTLRGYKGNKPSMSSLDSLDREWSKQDGDTSSKVPDGIDPSDWEFMTPEERRLFQ